jgi:hypothetical protein
VQQEQHKAGDFCAGISQSFGTLGALMTYQEILEGIARHRANPLNLPTGWPEVNLELQRKCEEIEWALQALAEKLRDRDIE